MGLKTEGTGTILMAKAKARTESLGGLIYPVGGDWSQPAFVTEGSALSFITGFFACNTTVVKEPTGALTYEQVKAASDRFTFFSNVKK